jgi:hypothetical protein
MHILCRRISLEVGNVEAWHVEFFVAMLP